MPHHVTATGARLTFIMLWCTGDVDQLPPVGPGKVLSDAIQSGVIPGVDLRQIFRQAQQSNIVRAAHAVNRGDFQALPLTLPIAPIHPAQVRPNAICSPPAPPPPPPPPLCLAKHVCITPSPCLACSVLSKQW